MIRCCCLCPAEIPAERLEALPDTEVCVKCSEKIGGEVEVRGVTIQLGRQGALKRVTGGVDVVFIRKPIRGRRF